MARIVQWADSNRDTLGEMLPDALVVLPMGSTEQHGPHLPTGTDTLAAVNVLARAARLLGERDGRDVIIAPPLPFGASKHHVPLGGTLTLDDATLVDVLTQIAGSVARAGGRRLVLVNGHGGNRGACSSAAAAASASHDLRVAVVHYWQLLEPYGRLVPGHAGLFETSLVLAAAGHLVGDRPERGCDDGVLVVDGAEIHDTKLWARIDGFTDDPSQASQQQGQDWLDDAAARLAETLLNLSERM